jgi:hypothetical protein
VTTPEHGDALHAPRGDDPSGALSQPGRPASAGGAPLDAGEVLPGGTSPAGASRGEDAAFVGGPEADVPRRSGLRNPEAAVRGLGAGTLALEAIVLLLAIQPIRLLGGDLSSWGIGAVVTLAVLAAVIAGSMKRTWAWHAGTALQVLLLASGLLHWSLTALGLIFGAAWGYSSYVRKTILG